jgi:hypothetical protein
MIDKAPIKGRKGSAGRNFYSLILGNESTKKVINTGPHDVTSQMIGA